MTCKNHAKDIESADERGYWRGYHKGQADLIERLKEAHKELFIESVAFQGIEREQAEEDYKEYCAVDGFFNGAIKKASESAELGSYGNPTEKVHPSAPENAKTPLEREAEASIRLDRNQTWSEDDKPEKPKKGGKR